MPIFSEANTIFINGDLSSEDKFRLLSAIHNTVEKRGYRDVILDFSDCTKAFSSEMLAISSRCQGYWKEGVEVSLTLPKDRALSRLFQNTNWAHLIDEKGYDPSRWRGYTHAPALKFSDGREQHQSVNKTLDVLLAAISHFRRDEIRYIEWALNEITDNVVNHACSESGGLLQVTNHRQSKQIEMVVCDCGVGIPTTLRNSDSGLRSDSEALDAAIKQGVTRDKNFGQGNGLYGTWRITQKSGGKFQIHSGNASLVSSERDGLHITRNQILFNGTLVVARIGYSSEIDLSDALMISGKPHLPTDYIDTHFNEDEAGNFTFVLKNESDGFGSRAVGEPVRRKLINVIGCLTNGSLIVDFADVPLVSSSYADEVFGKLFLELGPLNFMQKIEFKNLDPLVGGLIDRAIAQRMGQK